VNYFQPSFKLVSKTRDGVSKKYHLPATPHERLIADVRVTERCKDRLRQTFSTLDPIDLLNQLRAAQSDLAQHETAWRDGEVRPTHRKPYTGPRAWRTRADPFEAVWPLV
jgi:hypothetical protein